MGFLSALAGGAAGFLTGGPAGAVVGALGGLAGSSKSGRTTSGSQSSTSNSSNTQTSTTTLAGMSQDQAAIYDQNTRLLMEGGLDSVSRQKILDEQYAAAYNPQAQAINQAYQTAGAQDYANAARRGVAGNSRSADTGLLRTSAQASDLATASANATLQARQAALQEEANRRANSAMSLEILNQQLKERLAGSTVTTTQDGTTRTTGSSSTVAPDTTLSDAFAGIGMGLANNPNAVNDLFGGL